MSGFNSEICEKMSRNAVYHNMMMHLLAAKMQPTTPCPISAGDNNKEDVNPMAYGCEVKAPRSYKASYNDAVAVATIKAPESDLSKARERLDQRLISISGEKDADLRKQFSMDLPLPKTRKELFDGLAAGTFKLELSPEKFDRPVHDYEPFRSISIANPAKDAVSFEKARDAKRAAREDARDIILTQDEKAGLDALNAFKTWTFSA